MTKIPLSVVILTKNEEEHIRACLESVTGWAAEIIVVDDESSDRTADIARQFTDRIYLRRMENEGCHRNWAYAQANQEWVLSLDADEMVTPELQYEISQVIDTTDCHALSVPLRNYIGEHWVRYNGWYPASKLKLFRKGRFRYEEVEVHPRAFVDGKTGELTREIIHKVHKDFAGFLNSVNNQSTLEAKKWLRTGQSMTTGRIVRRTIDRFLRSYIQKRGFKDGVVGFMVAYFSSMYQVMSYAKYWEMKRSQKKSSLDNAVKIEKEETLV